MKKIIYIPIIIVVLLMAIFSGSEEGDKNSNLSSSDAVKNQIGKNLVSSETLSDPSVVLLNNTVGKLDCKFPATWQHISEAQKFSSPLTMWFTSVSGGKLSISMAESNDGVVWNDVQEGVLKSGPNWDKIGVETASVIKDPQGKYRMYYSSSLKESDDFAIGLATGGDGKSWTKNDRPLFESENEWEKGEPNGVLEPAVIYDQTDKIYKMWYNGLGTKDNKLAFRIGYATSPDGLTWQRLKQPVLEPGALGQWDDVLVSHVNVVKSQDGYHMLYFGVSDWDDGVAFQKGAIGHAYSKDGINWQKNPNNPVIKPRAETWDKWTVGGPSALISDNAMWVWYFGNHKNNSYEGKIGLVKATCQ